MKITRKNMTAVSALLGFLLATSIGKTLYQSSYTYSEKATKFCENLRQLFVLLTASQLIGGDFATCCGLLRICI